MKAKEHRKPGGWYSATKLKVYILSIVIFFLHVRKTPCTITPIYSIGHKAEAGTEFMRIVNKENNTWPYMYLMIEFGLTNCNYVYIVQ